LQGTRESKKRKLAKTQEKLKTKTDGDESSEEPAHKRRKLAPEIEQEPDAGDADG